MGKHNAKRAGITTGLLGGLLAFGAIITASPAAADVDDTNTTPAADPSTPAPVKHNFETDFRRAVRTALELGRERPEQKYPAPLVRYAQVWGDSLLGKRTGPDGEYIPYTVTISESRLAQEYRKAFGAAAYDPDVVAVCGNTNGCDGYIKGVLNSPLPRLSQADRINTAGYAQRTGSCKGLPTGALQRCQSAGK
ncbi:hypothetical protein SEA_EDUGATOR_73 [Mycobacterium phage Edugator]|uniref:Uncharacterized protein n=4 Tax=Kratiovirus larva TaxID=1056831 RepID=A0A221J790_9CAUD|nr:hypothetical protein CL76_gp26 [Mycobacterium phage Larva]ASM62583.1 hypothetical protein SEA_ALLEYCAT_77 [Mycobacterium phage AlleyCat]ASR85770.1 hypothetical protein SEA_EDUGATOR_73 [Mycobacterium phage Edugator]QQV92677.1 hypothetical protein SEA_PSYCHO_75 [Mycobacterium phage Psycho]WAB09758.1 hypothetical protein SEA_DADOSKY_77 [Mycobacterium phage Dadosky]AEL19724.1 hypothetical protein LARVA_76 [Mycobacterium phage Larva]